VDIILGRRQPESCCQEGTGEGFQPVAGPAGPGRRSGQVEAGVARGCPRSQREQGAVRQLLELLPTPTGVGSGGVGSVTVISHGSDYFGPPFFCSWSWYSLRI
jgi:hypothetical protein